MQKTDRILIKSIFLESGLFLIQVAQTDVLHAVDMSDSSFELFSSAEEVINVFDFQTYARIGDRSGDLMHIVVGDQHFEHTAAFLPEFFESDYFFQRSFGLPVFYGDNGFRAQQIDLLCSAFDDDEGKRADYQCADGKENCGYNGQTQLTTRPFLDRLPETAGYCR